MTTSSATPTTDRERRGSVRRRSGTIAWVSQRGYGTARCTILDVSDDGARIQAPCGLRIGDSVTLSEDRKAPRSGTTMWIEADIIGLHFHG